MFPANWIKIPQGGYCQVCERLWSPTARCGGRSFTGTCVLFQDRPPSAARFPPRAGAAGATPAHDEPQCSDGPITKARALWLPLGETKHRDRGTDPHARLATSGYPEAKKHPDSCRRRAKLHTSQGPTLFDLCDRPILVLSDLEILTCEYGAGLICVILG